MEAPTRSPWLGHLFLLGGALICAAYFAAPEPVRTPLFWLTGAISAAAVVTGVVRNRPARRTPWCLVGAGYGCFMAGDIAFDLDVAAGLSTAAYCLGYPLLLAAAALLLNRHAIRDVRAIVLDATIVAIALGGAQGVFVIRPALAASAPVPDIVAMHYPIFDLLILLVLVRAGTWGWRVRAYRLFAWSVLAMLVGDVLYSVDVNGYVAGGVADGFWLASYVLAGTAALDPSMNRLPAPVGRVSRLVRPLRVGLLALAMLAPPVVLAICSVTSTDAAQLTAQAIECVVIGALVLTRFVVLLQEQERLRQAEWAARAEAEAARADVAAQNDRLRHLDRVKDDMLAAVSHDFRTPLTAVRGHAGLVRRRGANLLADAELRSLDTIDHSAGRLIGLVENLLLVAQLRVDEYAVDPEPCDLVALADAAVEAVRPAADAKGIGVELVGPGSAAALVDAGPMARVLDNLITNAVKFSPPDTCVEVRIGSSAGRVRLTVADHGPGIAEPDLETVFEPFARGQAARAGHTPGAGLGLYISKRIVEAHGGTIAIHGEEGAGTTVEVEVPAAQPGDAVRTEPALVGAA